MKKKWKHFFYPSRKIFYIGYIYLLILATVFLFCNKALQHRYSVIKYENFFEKYGFSYDYKSSDLDRIEFLKEDGSNITLNMKFDGFYETLEEGKYDLNYCDDAMFEMIGELTPYLEINTYREQIEECITQKTYETNPKKYIRIDPSDVMVFQDEYRDSYNIVIFFRTPSQTTDK